MEGVIQLSEHRRVITVPGAQPPSSRLDRDRDLQRTPSGATYPTKCDTKENSGMHLPAKKGYHSPLPPRGTRRSSNLQ
jgi:hypothetical protein